MSHAADARDAAGAPVVNMIPPTKSPKDVSEECGERGSRVSSEGDTRGNGVNEAEGCRRLTVDGLRGWDILRRPEAK